MASHARVGRLLTSLGAGSVVVTMSLLASAPAQAGSLPDETGKKYSDASTAYSGAGFTPVISATVGDKVAWPDCLVTHAQIRNAKPPPNSSGSVTAQVLVSLNCYSAAASAKSPGYSAASPEGKAIVAANAKANAPAG
jgi:hypothetical protein